MTARKCPMRPLQYHLLRDMDLRVPETNACLMLSAFWFCRAINS